MEKLKRFRNRLSVSVDKLSPNRRGRSPPSSRRSVVSSGDAPGGSSYNKSTSADPITSVPYSPGVPMRRNRNRSARPNSLEESDMEDVNSANTSYMDTSAELLDPPQIFVGKLQEQSQTLGCSCLSAPRRCSPAAAESLTPPAKLNPGTETLMMEVMKEVQKIDMITDDMKQKSLMQGLDISNEVSIQKLEEKIDFIDNADDTEEIQFKTKSSSNTKDAENTFDVSQSSESMMHSATSEKQLKYATEANSSMSTLHAESLTSGYFSDSTSESSATTKPKPAATVFSTLSNIDDKPPPKKESIYSKLLKRKEKDKVPEESKPKEPIYARIKPKPKLKLDTSLSFKPIEPSSPKCSAELSPVIKPEPIYSKVKSRTPGCLTTPSVPNSPNSPGVLSSGPRSSFSPPNSNGEPSYSKIKPKSSTLPSVTSVNNDHKRESNTFPRDIPLESPQEKYPIYTQPLPSLPISEEEERGRQMSSGDKPYYYGKVTVKEKEISPSRANVITISNPVYVPSPPSSPRAVHPVPRCEGSIPSLSSSPAVSFSIITGTPPLSPPHRRSKTSRTNIFGSDSEFTQRKSQDMTPIMPPPKLPKSNSKEKRQSKERSDGSASGSKENILGSNSCIAVDSDTESNSRTLSRLVEELAIELEAVSRRLGNQVSSDDSSKKEVLAKLLATYDIPKNLRRVPEVNEEDILESERKLISASASADELRLVDEHPTYYVDMPDYSQDEFVIALDDETDPKYAALTYDMRQQQQRGVVDMSPGKVSRRSAQVYVNVINVLSALKVLVNSNSSKAATVITRMGTLARPYTKKVHTSVQSSVTETSWIQRRIYHISGHNGFDELRRYIKGGGEFCKELAVILQERSDLESAYAKGLHKLAGKLIKASRDSLGSVHQAWQVVGQELDNEADVHRVLAASLADDVTRPLRQLLDTQHKVRKGVEGMVDKTTRNVHEWRTAEFKAKKQSHSACRENEKIQDMAIEARLGRGKTLSEKEAVKMEKQRRKAEELVQRSEVEYYTCAVRAERARLEWESAIYKGTTCFQTLEEERLAALKQLVEKYHHNIKIAAPKMAESGSRLEEPVSQCDVEKDVATIINAKGTGENIPHQLLPDFYSEDINNIMNRDRRREALDKLGKMFRGDIEREKRGKQGVENLAKALQETPNFGGEDSQQDVNDKLQHMRAMLAFLEASRHKTQCSLSELEHRQRPSHPLERHIHTTRDKQGMMVSVLKVPAWITPDSASPDQSPLSDSPADSPNWRDRGTGDGNSVQPDSDFVGKSVVQTSDEFGNSYNADTDYQDHQDTEASKEDNKDLIAADRCHKCKPNVDNSELNHSAYDASTNNVESAIASDYNNFSVSFDAIESSAIPKAANRKRKNSKRTNNYTYVSIGNTPSTLSKHNDARDARSKPNSHRSTTLTTSAISSPITSTSSIQLAGKSSTLTSNKSSGSASNAAVADNVVATNTTRRVPDGMRLRVFLPPIRYPSLPTLPSDEFSSQGSDREYQAAMTSDDNTAGHHAINNHVESTYANTNNEKNTNLTSVHTATTTNSTANAPTSNNDQHSEETRNQIATIGFYETQPPPVTAEVAMGRCKALYDYDANMYDELTIRTGDIIQLHSKQPDGWWVGELDGTVGIFPATYVEEID